jgi:hypothetical protein
MPFRDFRDFLDARRKQGELIDIDRPAGKVCGPAVAEHGLEYVEVADVPGWQTYDLPELRNRSPS